MRDFESNTAIANLRGGGEFGDRAELARQQRLVLGVLAGQQPGGGLPPGAGEPDQAVPAERDRHLGAGGQRARRVAEHAGRDQHGRVRRLDDDLGLGEGAGPQRSAFLSAFFTLVGCHGAHVTAGLLWIGTMMAQIWAKGFRQDIVRRLLCLSIFWHALDIIWVAIFTIVYLIGTLS